MSVTSQKNFNLLASILSKHPLVKVNKELLLEQLRNEIFEMDRNKEKYNNSLLSMNKKIIYNMTQFNPLTTVKIKQKEKLSNFDIRLKEQQEEFNNFNSKKPDEIDFRDKHENSPISSLDETLKRREEELKNILKSNKKKINKSLFNPTIKTVVKGENEFGIENEIINTKTNSSNKEIIKNQNIIITNQKTILRNLDFLLKN